MPNYTRAWGASYEALPPDSGESASQGATRIRQLKLDIRERLALDHHWNDNLATGSLDGYHTKVTMPQRAKPTQEGNCIILFGKDYNNGTNTRTELYAVDEDNNEIRLTERGQLALENANVYSGEYTPTVTEVTNGATFTAVAAGPFHYARIGAYVFVTGSIDLDLSSIPAGNQGIRINLPIASNLANDYELSGVANVWRGSLTTLDDEYSNAHIGGDVTNNAAAINWQFTEADTCSLDVSFSYKVI